MPRSDTADIAHTAMSDHRILRRPEKASSESPLPALLRPGELPLVHFHRQHVGVVDRGLARDLGIALVIMARSMEGSRAGQLSGLALPRLQQGLKLHPEDLMALESKAYALWSQGRGREAMPVYEAVLARAPRRETALDEYASLLGQFGRRDEALISRRRTIEINPWHSRYHLELARLLVDDGQWTEAEAACRDALRLNPTLVEARALLVKCCAQRGDRKQARAEFDKLMALDPPNKDELRRQFADLP